MRNSGIYWFIVYTYLWFKNRAWRWYFKLRGWKLPEGVSPTRPFRFWKT